MRKVKIIICVVLVLGMSYAAYAQKKPDNLEHSLHLFYKNELFHKKFFDGFAKDLLSGFFLWSCHGSWIIWRGFKFETQQVDQFPKNT